MSGPKHLWSGDWERESAETSGAEVGRRQAQEGPATGENAGSTPDLASKTNAGNERRNGRIAVAATLAVLVIAVIVIVATSGSGSRQPTSAASLPHTATATSPTPTSPGQTSPGQTSPGQTSPGQTSPGPTSPGQTSPNLTIPNPANPSPTPATPPTTTSATPTTPTVAPQPVNWLGMEILTIPSGAAVIDAITPGGAGDRAGLTPGDTIIAVDGHRVTGSASIARAVSGRHKGQRVTLTVVRGGTTLDVQTPYTGPPTAYP